VVGLSAKAAVEQRPSSNATTETTERAMSRKLRDMQRTLMLILSTKKARFDFLQRLHIIVLAFLQRFLDTMNDMLGPRPDPNPVANFGERGRRAAT